MYLGDLLIDVISLRAATRKLEFDPGGDQLAKSRLDRADGPKGRDPPSTPAIDCNPGCARTLAKIALEGVKHLLLCRITPPASRLRWPAPRLQQVMRCHGEQL